MVTVHEENYFSGDLLIKGDLPVSTKGDPLSHGYGFRSMRTIVERYGGALTCGAQDGVFHLNAIIPAHTEKQM
jgi:sensor histidine kinase regulating citrate/malate metabolism